MLSQAVETKVTGKNKVQEQQSSNFGAFIHQKHIIGCMSITLENGPNTILLY